MRHSFTKSVIVATLVHHSSLSTHTHGQPYLVIHKRQLCTHASLSSYLDTVYNTFTLTELPMVFWKQLLSGKCDKCAEEDKDERNGKGYLYYRNWKCWVQFGQGTEIFFFEVFHSVHSWSQSLLLFQLNGCNMLNTHIYHQLSPTGFSVCYTIFKETTALLAHKLYAFCNVVT